MAAKLRADCDQTRAGVRIAASAEWCEWLDRVCEKVQRTRSQMVGLAMEALAERDKLPQPPRRLAPKANKGTKIAKIGI